MYTPTKTNTHLLLTQKMRQNGLFNRKKTNLYIF